MYQDFKVKMQKKKKNCASCILVKFTVLYRRLTVRSVPFYCAALLSSIKAFFPIESALTYIQLPVFQPRLQSVYTETQQLSTAVMRTTGARC